MAGRFSVEAVFKAVDRVTAPVSRMQKRVGRFTRSMNRNFKSLDRTVTTFGNGLKRASQTLVVSLALIGGALGNVVGAGAGFEQAITDVGAVSLKTRDQIADLEKMALQLGATTKFTATQAANAMEVLARAGFKQNEILAATPAVLSAAAASGLEIAEVANHVSNVLKGMGLETSEAARVADVLALASARTNSSIGSLGESMKNVSATARQLGVPLEDVVASVALLQDVGLDASVAGSAMNVMLTKMAAPSERIKKAMRRLSVSFKKVNGDMKTLPEVISEISKASAAMGGNFDQVAFLAELVGLRGQKAAANLKDLFETGKLKDLTAELKEAKGVADEMAKIRMNTVTGSLTLLESAVDAVKVKIFGMHNGPLKDVIDRVTEWVSANNDLIATGVGDFITKVVDNMDELLLRGRQVAGFIVAFVVLSAAIKLAMAAIVVFKGVMFAVGVVMGTVRGIMAAYFALVIGLPKALALARVAILAFNLAMFANPVGLIVLGIAALIAIAAAVILAWEPVTQFFADLWDKIKQVVGGVSGAVSKFGEMFGFTTPDAEQDERTGADAQQAATQVISPQERIARQIDEQRTTNNAEVLLTATPGTRAEVVGGRLGGGVAVANSGGL